MISLIKSALLSLYGILPDSPIRAAMESTAFDGTFLSYLNWFVPFDTCTSITLAWIDCMLAYYIFLLVKDVVFDKLLGIIMNIASG